MFDMRTTARGLVAALFALTAVACGGGADSGETAGGAAEGEAATAAAAPQVQNPATLTGTVTFTGTAPANEAIDMSEEQVCADKHTEPPHAQTVIANNGKLANVFVYIKEGITGTYPPPQDSLLIDQDGCIYHPHVSGVMVGETIAFKNSDGILHNIKVESTANRGFNVSQPTTMITDREFSTQEVMVPIECNVHGWMNAYIGVVAHPYFAVSGEDGTFRIENLPPGTYTVEAWHEKYGTQTQQVTVGPNESKEITFGYDASMANAHVPLGEPLDPHGMAGHRIAAAGGH